MRLARVARDEHITMVNNNYGNFWCSTVGTSLEELVHNVKHGLSQTPVTRSMRLKVYDAKARKVDVRAMVDMLNLIVSDEDILLPRNLCVVRCTISTAVGLVLCKAVFGSRTGPAPLSSAQRPTPHTSVRVS